MLVNSSMYHVFLICFPIDVPHFLLKINPSVISQSLCCGCCHGIFKQGNHERSSHWEQWFCCVIQRFCRKGFLWCVLVLYDSKCASISECSLRFTYSLVSGCFSNQITAALITELGDKNWKVRGEALQKVRNKMLSSFLYSIIWTFAWLKLWLHWLEECGNYCKK